MVAGDDGPQKNSNIKIDISNAPERIL